MYGMFYFATEIELIINDYQIFFKEFDENENIYQLCCK